MTETPLAGRVALVTGAGVRVGRAVAEGLADAGADVAVHHRSSGPAAEIVAAGLRSRGRRAFSLGADLADPEQCRELVREAVARLGTLDFLVHSAANFHRASLADSDESLWDSAMNVNARSAFLLAREAAPVLRERRGRIVLVSDFLALQPARGYTAHSVSKAAVEGLVRALAIELAPEVTVNGIAPGTVLVPEGTPAETSERWARRVPLKRHGDPADVAAGAVFLCSGPAFITGQILRIDGGRSIV